MSELAVERLERLAGEAGVGALASLQAQALRASLAPGWAEWTWEPATPGVAEDVPLLHRATLRADVALTASLLTRLCDTAVQSGHANAAVIREAIGRQPLRTLELLEACINQDQAHIEALAAGRWSGEGENGGAGSVDEPANGLVGTVGDAPRLDGPLLGVLGQLVALPLLQAAGRRAGPWLEGAHWEVGYCPVCAAWPTLAELRGLERLRWLRCGRCGASWQMIHQACAYCGNDDHRTLGYLAPEKERESRRASTCSRCKGYLKTFATLSALSPVEVLVRDVDSLELDLAALDAGFARPAAAGCKLDARVRATRRSAVQEAVGCE